MTEKFRRRRIIFVTILFVFLVFSIVNSIPKAKTDKKAAGPDKNDQSLLAVEELDKLPIKGRAPKTGYSRAQFGEGWKNVNGCDMRNIILNRDLRNVSVDFGCRVTKGTLDDPYTGKTIELTRGKMTSDDVQIDHVVALSDAWQKGAQLLPFHVRVRFANDPLELLAVDGQANEQKGDGDAASWLPKNKLFRCEYVTRQIAVKKKYDLWVTAAEHGAIKSILASCPNQSLPKP
jgi:hypothetical protein